MTAVGAADALAAVSFLATLGLVPRIPARVLPGECRVLLGVCLGIYGFVGVSNVCQSFGLTQALDVYEDYAELLFIPFFGYFVYAYGSAREKARREATEAALREAEHRLRQVVDVAFEGIAVSEGGHFVEVNEGFASAFDFSPKELVGTEVLGRVAPECRNDVAEKLAGGYARPYESVCLRRDGSRFPVEVCGKTTFREGRPARVTALRDLTERKREEEDRRRLETRMQEAQRLESLGVLAGGIAHDFNNLLMGILGNAELALLRLEREASQRTYLERIIASAERAAGLTRQMLHYAGQSQLQVGPVSLPSLLREMRPLLEAAVPKKAELRLETSEGLPAVLGDESQLRQVVMNLVTNAAEALGKDAGTVTVAAGVVHADATYLSGTHLAQALPAGRYVYLEVADTGCGMDEDTRQRLFDPFFTTKFVGRGLGLAAALGIVRAHGGGIRVTSSPGRGTAVRVLLPTREGAVESRSAPLAAEAPSGLGGNRRAVLVVDDEPQVREVARSVLEEAGFSVFTAPDGREGVRLFRERQAEIGAVLLDAAMPHLSGTEAAVQIQGICPGTPVFLSSGYSEEQATEHLESTHLAGFLQKPYRPAALVEKLRAVLPPPPAQG